MSRPERKTSPAAGTVIAGDPGLDSNAIVSAAVHTAAECAQSETLEDMTKRLQQCFEVKTSQLRGNDLVVAIAGVVNAGKTSLTKAIFNRKRNEPESRLIVSSFAGATKVPTAVKIVEGCMCVDLPGTDDVSQVASVVATSLLSNRADVCILVLNAQTSITESFVETFRVAKEKCKFVFVVLNQIDTLSLGDEFDYSPRSDAADAKGGTRVKAGSAKNFALISQKVTRLETQMRARLGMRADETIYLTCCRGYDLTDPEFENKPPCRIGVDHLLEDLLQLLQSDAKALVVARLLSERRSACKKIILKTCAAVFAWPWFPYIGTLCVPSAIADGVAEILFLFGEDRGVAKVIVDRHLASDVWALIWFCVGGLLPTSLIAPGLASSISSVWGVRITIALMCALSNELLADRAQTDNRVLTQRFATAMATARIKGLAGGPSSWAQLVDDLLRSDEKESSEFRALDDEQRASMLQQFALTEDDLKRLRAEIEEANQCHICMNAYADMKIDSCVHKLCHTCGEQLLQSAKPCPFCRVPIGKLIPNDEQPVVPAEFADRKLNAARLVAPAAANSAQSPAEPAAPAAQAVNGAVSAASNSEHTSQVEEPAPASDSADSKSEANSSPLDANTGIESKRVTHAPEAVTAAVPAAVAVAAVSSPLAGNSLIAAEMEFAAVPVPLEAMEEDAEDEEEIFNVDELEPVAVPVP